MKKKILIGSIMAVVILTLVSFSSVVGYSSVKSDLDISVEEDATPTPIVLVFQLIAKLRNHKDIENVETEEEVLQIIEGDEELNSIVEQLSVEDCGCDDDSSDLGWNYPVTCIVLWYLLSFFAFIYLAGVLFAKDIADAIGQRAHEMNCWWA